MALPLLGMALMAGAAYKQHQTDKRNQERDDEDRAAVIEERTFRRSERDRATSERNRVADAYAPVGMTDVMTKPDTADNIDVGTPGTELVNTGAKRVGQQTFGADQMPQAEAAVTAANTPEAQTARASQAMLSMGNVAGAQQLRTGARQEKLAGLQLDEAQQKAVATAFDVVLQSLASHDQIATTVSGSNLGGALQLKAVPSADGKSIEYQMVGPDGTAKPTGYSFSNDPRGLLEAKAAMSKLTPVTQKLEYLHKQDQLKRQEVKDAADAKFKQAEFDQKQPLVDSQVAENKARAGYYQAGGAQSGKAPAVERMSEPDAVAAKNIERERGRIDKEISDIRGAIRKARAEGMWDDASPNATALNAEMRQLQESLGALSIKETTLMRKYQGTPAADPYGMPRGPAGAAAVPGAPGTRAGEMIPPHVQAKRDVEAGQQMVMVDFAGDLRRARAELAQLEQGIKSAPNVESRSMLTARLKALRAGIQSMESPMGTPAPMAATAPAAAPAAMPTAAPRGMADMAPAAIDPMAAQLAKESSELNRGQRTDFSPEVKAYQQKRKQAETAAAAAANEAARQQELQRALAASRAQLGR